MKIKEYVHDDKMSLEKFLEMDEDLAIKFDFLSQGDEPDRTNLAKEIYHQIFPWFDETKQAGDTLNTYRIAIKKYYGNYYRFLDRKIQLEILEIIKKNTKHLENHLFEFEEVDKDGRTYFQICNNYQLGNFGILPIRFGINPKRAADPYFDFFDSFIYVVNDFYADEIENQSDDPLKKAMIEQSDYFNQFNDTFEFIENNFLEDYIISSEEEEYSTICNLSDCDTFEEYVSMAAQLIEQRGRRIWNKLKNEEILVEDTSAISYENLQKKLQNLSERFKYRYSVDHKTAMKMAEIIEYSDTITDLEKIYSNYREVDLDLNAGYEEKMRQESLRSLTKKFGWTRWWYWIVLYIVVPMFIHLIFNLIKFDQFHDKWEMTRTVTRLFYGVFWVSLVSKVIYNLRFLKSESEFEKEKSGNIEYLKETLERKANKLKSTYSSKITTFNKVHKEELNLGYSLPEKYRNTSDIYSLIMYIKEGRADNFKEAYELLENFKHRDKIESEASIATIIAQNAANAQRSASIAIEKSAERQAQAAESQARETERHNREVESRWYS